MAWANESRRRSPSSSIFGVLLSSICLLAILSILAFAGKLDTFVVIREYYHTVIGSQNTVGIDTNSSDLLTTESEPQIEEGQEKDNNDTIRSQRGADSLEVAWLMSFPNSGTTYTNHLIQGYTNTTTATNYGHEQSTKDESISIFSDSIDGPFFRYPSRSLPPKYILTKTHCGGECDDCQTPGHEKYIDTLDDFERACRTGKRIANGTKVRTTYAPDIPKRAVHLIRDPFDNIVARLHNREGRWADRDNERKFEERLHIYNRTKEGFRAYCQYRDNRSFKIEKKRHHALSIDLFEYTRQIPCYAEFITYVLWHNHAIALVAEKCIPVLTMFYEDYETNWNRTVNKLLDFLLLSPAEGTEAEKFIIGKHYKEYYEDHERKAVVNLVQGLASEELWALLQRYLS